MAKIDRQQILNKTHYGIGIYAHILREYYPDEVVMRLSSRDCGLCRNPFAEGSNTLHVWIHKTELGTALSPEYALHHDNSGTISDGDAFDFAALHFKQVGNELLQTLNKSMNLRIGEDNRWYRNSSPIEAETYFPQFSFFRSPITNVKPYKDISLLDAYNYIVGNCAKANTAMLRNFADPKRARMFKAANFDYCTFSGTFDTRSDKGLIQHSGLLCVDFDHVQVDELRSQLLHDTCFDTQLLFRSPSGDGLKWVVEIDISTISHADYFRAVANYLLQTYGVEADKSGKDISRACFLPHDPNCFINPKFLHQ